MLQKWLPRLSSRIYFMADSLYFFSLHSGSTLGKGLQSFSSSCFWASNCFAQDSKELSSILDCFGDHITNKNTKTYTKWLKLIARVLNILIGLKGNNYYSKVFKRINYKLSNSTFWVVIIRHDVTMLDLTILLLSLWCIAIDFIIQPMSLILYMTCVH